VISWKLNVRRNLCGLPLFRHFNYKKINILVTLPYKEFLRRGTLEPAGDSVIVVIDVVKGGRTNGETGQYVDAAVPYYRLY
jgi:hypothetical protein